MNIKAHIEAGHYPTDDKGRALVPTRGGAVVTILATDLDRILGWSLETGPEDWSDDGGWFEIKSSQHDLMPPGPHKVKVTAYAITDLNGRILRLREDAPAGVAAGIELVVTLTGEIEVTR